MKKVLLSTLLVVFLNGCSLIEVNSPGDNGPNFVNTYSENVFVQSMYLTRIHKILNDNTSDDASKVKTLKNYSQGFSDGTSRRDIYKAVEPTVYSKLADFYDEATRNQIKEAYSALSKISNQVIDFMKQKVISKKAIEELSEKIEVMLPLLYPASDDKELTLYSLLYDPKEMMENHNEEQIKVFLKKVIDEMNQLMHFLEQNTAG